MTDAGCPDFCVDPERAQWEAFKALPRDEPVQMLNLVRFRDLAAYPDGHPQAGKGLTGADAYANYGRESGPIFSGLGGRIVWTRHNARPHDPHCAETYAELTAALSDRADVIHCHSWGAVDHLAQTGPLDMAKTVVIAHGSYCGHYRGWPRRKARESFGFPDDAHVFLLAGRLAGYKRIRQSAEGLLRHPAPHIRLLIAGADPDAMLDDLPDDPRLSLHRGFVNDAEIGRFYAAADTALLPYAASLSSGQALLAAGFGTGILGSDTTGLRAVVTPGVGGTLFDPDAPDALDAALERAVAMGPDPWRRFGQAGAAAAARRDWAGIGQLWAGLFTGLAAGRPVFDPADAWIGPAQ